MFDDWVARACSVLTSLVDGVHFVHRGDREQPVAGLGAHRQRTKTHATKQQEQHKVGIKDCIWFWIMDGYYLITKWPCKDQWKSGRFKSIF